MPGPNSPTANPQNPQKVNIKSGTKHHNLANMNHTGFTPQVLTLHTKAGEICWP